MVKRCQQLICEWLSNIGLELKPSKTKLVHTYHSHSGEKPGFNFLGFTIRQFPVGKHHSGQAVGNRHRKGELLGFKTIISPATEKIQTHYKKIAEEVNKHKATKQVALIKRLNPMIRGWCNYQSPWNSKEDFGKLDYLVWKRLWQWAYRRHPRKGKKWIAKKYWRTINNDNWTFASPIENSNPYQLLKHYSFTAGRRWIKVKGTRSPYDGDETYWSVRMGDNYLTVDPQKARLMKNQKGKCAHCGLHFKPSDVIEKHHLNLKSRGGNNSDKNLILVHLHCHDLLHEANHTEPL